MMRSNSNKSRYTLAELLAQGDLNTPLPMVDGWDAMPDVGLEVVKNNMILFLDTEFTDLHSEAKLISIGIVSEDGRTFYAELSDTYQVAACSDFVRESVLPLLQGGEARMTLRDLTRHLGLWLENFGEPVKLATDSEGWDWRWLSRIFVTPGTWPQNLDSRPLLLDTTVAFQAAVQKAFADGLRPHHALDDAKANRLGWFAINQG